MKLKDVKMILSQLKTFSNPKIKYEQYLTPPDLSATMLHTIHRVYNDIENKKILDLCGGTGMLGINSLFYSPESVTNLDIDNDALIVSKENAEFVEKEIEIINADLRNYQFERVFDTCLLNPPFGMKNKGIDIEAIEFALKYSRIVYVLHSNKTRDYYLRKFKNIEIIAEMKYDLPQSYSFHKKKQLIIDVDLYRIVSD